MLIITDLGEKSLASFFCKRLMGDMDKLVCPCHPLPIASPKSVIIRIIVIYETILLSEMWHKCPFYKPCLGGFRIFIHTYYAAIMELEHRFFDGSGYQVGSQLLHKG